MMKQLLLFLFPALLLASCSAFKSSKTSEPYPGADTTTPRNGGTYRPGQSGSTGNAQTDYIERFKNAAVNEMQRAGIPASITLAQGIIESASGQSELAVSANNHFGIKCGNSWNGKTHYKQDDDRDPDGKPIESCFRKYTNPDESFVDHSEFLRDPRKSNRYGFLFNLDKRDYKNWARGLQSAGYATSRTYADQLIEMIERLRLYEFDQPGAVTIKPGGIIPANEPPQSRIYRVNDVKTVNSRSGETVADIARIYRLRGDKVADYNDRAYPPGQNIPPGTRVFIQEKRDSWRGQTTHHFVRDRQTMLEIAQQYGIKLDKLLERNGLNPGQEPAANEKIRLRGKRSSDEKIRLRSDFGTPGTPANPNPFATEPGSMTPDDNVLLDLGDTGNKTNTPSKPTTVEPIMTGKPSTTGVPYPPDTEPTDPSPATVNPWNPNPANPWNADAGSKTEPEPQLVPWQPASGGGAYHTVERGDTLYSISRKYNITVARLKQLNNMTNDAIQAGQRLRVQ